MKTLKLVVLQSFALFAAANALAQPILPVPVAEESVEACVAGSVTGPITRMPAALCTM